MRPSLLLLACVVAAAACSSDSKPAADSTTDTAVAADTGVLWNALMWNPQQRPTIDRGTGVIAFSDRKDAPVPRIDTLTFRVEPSDSAAPAGHFYVKHDTAEASWHWGVKAPDLDKPNLLEFADGVAGVPTDSSTGPNGRWVRGLLGTDKNGQMVTGWTDSRAPGLRKLQWATHLRRMPVFVLDTTTGAIADAAGGATHQLPPDDYQLYAGTEARGRWLQVRLVSPSDRCTTDKTPRTTTSGWVEYLDARGRPRVWYYLKGCPQ